ncbi:DUF1983 domain-containing protein [Paracoccus sp. 11-3]|uniref:DUF1983 domain-containing protein n=1 Tax=Paracoccus amoyensis TaxID=2760093 RepID=A0A926GDY1_9RHOB|nr:DUF1983 domain-containing protein [Paracoccus amoyensis]MBC9246751.1 DUF1983 domain-containing protein [Paracoccus amoyensis]
MGAAVAFVGGLFSFGAGAAFAAGGTAFAGWVAGATFGGTLLGGLAVKLLTSVAVSALSAAMAAEPPQGGGITISVTAHGEQQPETIILGRYATAGQAISAPYSHGSSNRHLTQIVELCSAPGAKLERVQMGDEWLELGSVPHEDYGRPVVDGKYEGRIWVKYYDGTQTEADPYLRSKYGEHDDRPWAADMIGAGLCYAILTFKYDQEDLPQVPNYRFEMLGIPLYDIRKDSTAGGLGPQRLNDPATWVATENPVVICWNLMRGIPLPGGEVYGGNIADLRQLPRALWVAAMNRADVQVKRQDGKTEATYRAGLEIALNQPPAAALEEFLKAASATIADLGYGWGIVAGPPALPVYSFSDDDIIVSRKQELDPFPALQDTYNAISAKFPDPEHFWETKEAPQRTNALWEASDVFGRRMASLSLPAVPYPRQVQRLMRAWLEDERRFRRHVIALPPDSAHVELVDTMDWGSVRNGYDGKDFTPYEILEDPRTGIRQFSLRERDPNDYSWQPGFELPMPPGPARPAPIVPADVSGFDAQAVILTDSEGNQRMAGIRLVWNPELIAEGLRWELRFAGSTEIVLRGDIQNISAGSLMLYQGILPSTNYEVHARLIKKRRTAWTSWRYVRTHDIRLGSHDVDFEEIKQDVRLDIDALEEWAGGSGDAQRALRDEIAAVRDSLAEMDFSIYSAHEKLRQEMVVEAANSRAAFLEEVDVAVSGTEAVALRVTTLDVTVGENTGKIAEESLVRAREDNALATDITTVKTALGNKANASTVQSLTTRVGKTEDGLEAQADATTRVEARTNRASASGLLRVNATASSDGALTRIAISAQAEADGTNQTASLFIEAGSDGTNQILAVADRFAIANGRGANAARQVPFVVNDGQVYMDRAFIKHADIDTLWIKDGAVGTWWSVNGASLTVSVSYPARLLVMTSARIAGRSGGWSVDYQLNQNGSQADFITFSVSPYTWTFSSFRSFNVPAGTHDFSQSFSGDQDAISQQRMLVLGMYR